MSSNKHGYSWRQAGKEPRNSLKSKNLTCTCCLQGGWNWAEGGLENGLWKPSCQGGSLQLESLREALPGKDDDLTGKAQDWISKIERRCEVNDCKDYRKHSGDALKTKQNITFLAEEWQEYETRSLSWHPCPGVGKRTGIWVRTQLPSSSPHHWTRNQIIIFCLFFPIHPSSKSYMSLHINKTNKNGWEVSVQTFCASPKPGNYIFQPVILIFFFLMPSYMARLSEQWSENQIRGQMPKPSRNVMEKKQKQVKGFLVTIFLMFKHMDFVISVLKMESVTHWTQCLCLRNALNFK